MLKWFHQAGLFSVAIIFAMLSSVAAKEVQLSKNSQPLARIYVAPESTDRTFRATVEDLVYHFDRMGSGKFEVVETSDASAILRPAIVLGSLAEKLGCKPKATEWLEGFRILVADGRVLINGETDQATSYGVYALLGQLGCDWVAPGAVGEIIPSVSSIAISEGDRSEAPAFGMRRFWYSGGAVNEKPQVEEFEVWKRRQRLGISPKLTEYGSGHYWEKLVNTYKEEFKKNPEMNALVKQPDGSLVRKIGAQVETTNPQVVDLIIRDIQKTFEKNKWPKDKAVTLPIGPGDGGGYSVSPESQALKSGRQDPMLGGDDVTDLVVKLANDVLEKIGAEYPNLSLGFLIYSVHADYPLKFKPHPRIYPIFAPISYSRYHSTIDPRSKSRAYYRSVVEQWSELDKKQGNRLLAYEYNYNLADVMLPFTRLQLFGEDLPYYLSKGIVGLDIECMKAWSIYGPHNYTLAKMAWNPSLDWKAVLATYCREAFGPAAPMFERYYRRLAETQARAGQEAGSYFSAPLIFDDAYVTAARKDLNEALAEKLDPRQHERAEAAAFPLQTLEQYLQWHKSLSRFEFAQAWKAYEAIVSGIKGQLAANPQNANAITFRYMNALLRDSTEQGLKYSSDPYQIVYRLPESLPTAIDPTDNGERMNLHAPEINDSQWPKTHTYESTWDAQGFFYHGTVWYRVRFNLPKDVTGKAVGLYLGGFEDEAKVWINGRYVGASGMKFAQPAVFDLTPGIREEGENLLAIKISRLTNMWELGMGGIFRPSFLFTGPQVVSSNNPREPEFRVLPGGATEPISK